jgi:DNA invertase Pin-like site-specific DNA recombinase
MRAVLYVRVSTTGQAEEGVSLKAQEARLRAWALANGAAEVRVFSDAGIGAGRMDNRPSFAAALAAVDKGAQFPPRQPILRGPVKPTVLVFRLERRDLKVMGPTEVVSPAINFNLPGDPGGPGQDVGDVARGC